MESCYSIMPLVVAETLLSADELKKDAKSEHFKGSPLLLQIWLAERLRLLEAPADPKHYRPIALGNRKYLHQGQDEAEWTSFFTYGVCSIKWVVPWWGLTTVTGVLMYRFMFPCWGYLVPFIFSLTESCVNMV
ncbi:uncharacterized protein [Spinacia oleracea]|uniref:Aminotransferase-like plant mobile domain-containing protein n=1 Tax=Spinacia oleracea TaxID=3562 RepID=A0ABM3REM5_SPIOL|nr:uncharacterized protein LOC130469117 [Spinacia oleracea]